MPIAIQSIFHRGGRELAGLLTHSVFSFRTDVLFLYVVREYQLRPQAAAAIAIFDVFCATNAPARISQAQAIPPRELQLQLAIEKLRIAVAAVDAAKKSAAAKETAAKETAATHSDNRTIRSNSVSVDPIDSILSVCSDTAGTADRADPCSQVDGESVTEEWAPQEIPATPLPPRYLFDAIADSLYRVKSEQIMSLESHYDPRRSPLENLPSGQLSAAQRAFVDNVWTPRIRPYLVSSGFWQLATVG